MSDQIDLQRTSFEALKKKTLQKSANLNKLYDNIKKRHESFNASLLDLEAQIIVQWATDRFFFGSRHMIRRSVPGGAWAKAKPGVKWPTSPFSWFIGVYGLDRKDVHYLVPKMCRSLQKFFTSDLDAWNVIQETGKVVTLIKDTLDLQLSPRKFDETLYENVPKLQRLLLKGDRKGKVSKRKQVQAQNPQIKKKLKKTSAKNILATVSKLFDENVDDYDKLLKIESFINETRKEYSQKF